MDRQSGPVQLEPSPPITQGLQHIATEPPAWAETAGRVIHYLMTDFAGGRRCLKLAWVINFQKLATIPLLAIFIFKYQNFSAAAWSGLVLGIRLAADLRHRYAQIPTTGLRLVQPMHKPLHTGLRVHDRL